ncbi:MAG: type II secretion system protein N [Ghiorsea sp.]
MVMLWERAQAWLQLSGPRWLEYILVLSASWMIAGTLIGDQLEVVQQQAQSSSQNTVKTSHADASVLQQVDLFGKKEDEAKPEVVATPLVVKASKLNVKLIGTVVAGERSAAVVKMNGSREQQVFFVGNEMQPGVTLDLVEATAIVVSNRGQQERISIEEGKAIAAAPAVKRIAPARARPSRINRSINRNHMEKQLRNFSQLLSQARVTPHFTNKKADGFTISEIVKGSLYEQIGLINGDVIRKVNGESVVSAEQAMRMYKELQKATNIDVEIERKGNIQQVSYAIQ